MPSLPRVGPETEDSASSAPSCPCPPIDHICKCFVGRANLAESSTPRGSGRFERPPIYIHATSSDDLQYKASYGKARSRVTFKSSSRPLTPRTVTATPGDGVVSCRIITLQPINTP
ncbi:hypothetical protein J6590_052441 [Homalodisca vitripennis]|nr:hypothetical protein J6590_052441 [Homalodisca vitripennis]